MMTWYGSPHPWTYSERTALLNLSAHTCVHVYWTGLDWILGSWMDEWGYVLKQVLQHTPHPQSHRDQPPAPKHPANLVLAKPILALPLAGLFPSRARNSNNLRAGQCCAPTAQNGPSNGRFSAFPPALSYLGPLRIPMDHGPLKLSSTHKQFRLEPSASSSFELALWPLSWLCCVLCPPAHAWLLGCCQSARVCCGVRAVQRETGNKQKSMQMARPRMVLTRALPR
ncbi:hypothetical protein GGP41_005908 [Bipolaris sorokiniana]|uniref:Uncharacterized protein n=1 Tax=Cochliobolus sativus TaxID=45130 RepID=A0A8H5ZFX5_COCSA|nr:hypothetical protein GGP41_005908 [Bipolaris sorokiniana]